MFHLEVKKKVQRCSFWTTPVTALYLFFFNCQPILWAHFTLIEWSFDGKIHRFNRFLGVSICGEIPGPVLQSQVYPCVGSSNSHGSLCFIPLRTWKHFIHPPQPATLITTVLITSNHWHLHLIRQGLQSLIVFEPCVLGRKHWTEIPTACYVLWLILCVNWTFLTVYLSLFFLLSVSVCSTTVKTCSWVCQSPARTLCQGTRWVNYCSLLLF